MHNFRALAPGLIAGLILGVVMAFAGQQWWWLPVGVVLGLAVMPFTAKQEKNYVSRKKRDENFRD